MVAGAHSKTTGPPVSDAVKRSFFARAEPTLSIYDQTFLQPRGPRFAKLFA